MLRNSIQCSCDADDEPMFIWTPAEVLRERQRRQQEAEEAEEASMELDDAEALPAEQLPEHS
jgi:hypothetical protein